MEKEQLPNSDGKDQDVNKENPNRIFEMVVKGVKEGSVATSSDKVYRALREDVAIKDLEDSGVVRSRKAAGVAFNPKYGKTVYWTKGKEGNYMFVDHYILEAPLAVAEARMVKKDDLTAIYAKDESGEIKDILTEIKVSAETKRQKDIEDLQAAKAQETRDSSGQADGVLKRIQEMKDEGGAE